MRQRAAFLLAAALPLMVPAPSWGQAGGPPPARSAREAARIDLTGYWVSLVTEDWRYRMVTPPKGDVRNVPLSAEGRRVANEWDPAADEKAGLQCKAYGAAGVMRQPGRLNIHWQDDSTLRIDTDAGEQTRLIHFGQPAASGERTWQGHSVGQWNGPAGIRGAPPAPGGSLQVVTTRMRPGYLQKNGVPYGENAMVKEFFDRMEHPDGTSWLIVTTITEDPQYLNQPFITSTHFKKIPDGQGWSPAPCAAR
jgi:hypothetical protein